MSEIDIKAHCQKLIDQGAVSMFHEHSEADLAADRATEGLPPGIPGLGLYRIRDGVYEARVEDRYQFEGCPIYHTLMADDWREYLRSREPRAKYINHHLESGNHPINWKQVIVRFRIEASE